MASVAEDWRSNPEWRDDYVFSAARAVSKSGDSGGHDDVLLELGRVLTWEEAAWSYGPEPRRREG